MDHLPGLTDSHILTERKIMTDKITQLKPAKDRTEFTIYSEGNRRPIIKSFRQEDIMMLKSMLEDVWTQYLIDDKKGRPIADRYWIEVTLRKD